MLRKSQPPPVAQYMYIQDSKLLGPVVCFAELVCTKAELPLEGIFFALNFLPWESLLVKKLEIEKTKTTKYTTFKTDIIKVVLVFSISKFFTNENSQGRKLSAVQLQ